MLGLRREDLDLEAGVVQIHQTLARTTGKPPSHVAEIGFGKDGQTVYFENKPEGMEKALKAEYAKRHP